MAKKAPKEQMENNDVLIKILIVLVITFLGIIVVLYLLNMVMDKGPMPPINEMPMGKDSPHYIEKKDNTFNDMGKILISEEMEKTDRCGLLGCELKVFTEGNWQLAKKTDVKYRNEEKAIEINIRDYEACYNEEYIIPPYGEGYIENSAAYHITYPYQANAIPCEIDTAGKHSSIRIQEKLGDNIDAYLADYTLIADDNAPDSSIKMKYNGEYIISYQSFGMIDSNCFLLLGDKYQYNVCKWVGEASSREIDTSILDDIKILK